MSSPLWVLPTLLSLKLPAQQIWGVKTENPPARCLWVGFVLLEDAYFDLLIHAPAPGDSNSSGSAW